METLQEGETLLEKVSPDIPTLIRGSPEAAGLDIMTLESVVMPPKHLCQDIHKTRGTSS